MKTADDNLKVRPASGENMSEGEILLRQVLESTQDAIFAIDRDYRLLFSNDQHKQALIASGSLPIGIGETVLSPGYPPDVLSYWQTAYDRALADEIFRLETPWTDTTGQVRTFENNFSPLRNARGEIIGVLIVAHDVTAHTLAEKRIEDSQKRFSTLFRSNPVPLGITDARDFRIVDVNDAWSELTGFSREEAIGHTSTELGLARPETLQSIRDIIKDQGGIRQYEIPLYTRAGQERQMLVTSDPIILEDNTYFLNNLLDITTHKQAEAKLRESEKRFSSIFKVNPVGIVLTRLEDGLVLDANDAFLHLFGYSREEVISRTTVELKVYAEPEDRERLIAKLKEQGHLHSEESVFRHRSGRTGTVLISAEILELDGSMKLLSMMVDITERKEADQILENTKNTLTEAQKIAHLGSFEYNALTQTTVWSEEEYNIYGLDPSGVSPGYEEMLARCIHPGDRDLLHETFTKAMQDRTVYELEHRIVRPDGSVRWVFDRAYPYFDENGDLLRYVGTTLDTTERKEAEEKLRESEQRYTILFQKSNVPVVLMKLPEVIIADANEAVEKLIGYRREELIGKTSADLGMINHEQPAESVTQFTKAGVLSGREMRIITKSGEKRVIMVDTNPVEISGQPFAFTSMIDITERKDAEEKLHKEKEKLDKIAASIPGILCSFHQDVDGKTSMPYASPAVKDVLGLDPADIAGDMTPVFSRILPEDIGHIAESIALSARTMSVWQDEYRYRHPEKGLVWIQGFSAPVREEDGSITWHGFVADITDRKRNDQLMRQWADAFENCAHGIAIGLPGTNNILTCNPSFARLQGRTIEEISSMPILQMYAHEDHRHVIDHIMKADRLGSIRYEAQMVRSDGSRYPVQMDVVSVRDEEGNILYRVATQQDITERKQAEEVRTRLAERLDLATRAAQIGIWDWDIQKNEIVWDEQMYALYGLQPGEFGGAYQAWLNGVHPDDRKSSNENSMRAVRGEGVYDTEFRVVWPDDTVHWLKADGQVFRDEHGNPLRMVGVNYDITRRKQAEEEREKLATLVETSPNFVGLASMDGKVQFINRGGRIMAGLHDADVTTMHITDFLPGEPDLLAPMMEEVMQKGWWQGELPLKNFQARPPVPVYMQSFIINHPQTHQPIGLGAMMQDITERKHNEQKIKSSEEKFRIIFDNASDGMFLVDFETRKFFMSNATCAAMLGYSPDEFLQLDMADLHPAGDLPDFFSSTGMHHSAESGKHGDIRFRRKNGEVFYADQSSTFIYFGERKYLLVVFRDVSERRKAEEELRAAKDKAEESDRLKTHFLANISHEIRTPMNGILGFTDLLRTMNPTGQQREKFFDIIHTSGERLMITINDLIEISSIQSGAVRMNETEININALLRFHLDFFELQSRQKGLRLSCITPLPDEKAYMFTDKHKLDSILINLIRNAIKFTQEGFIEFGYAIRENMLEFYVTDTGSGIPADRLDAIFERFVQANLQITRAHEGSGLGLSISKAYAGMLGGHIWVESKEGAGSTFRFTVPWRTRETGRVESETTSTRAKSDFLKERTVLVVEDDEINYTYLEKILSPLCKSVMVATNGTEAVRVCAQQSSISFVLMDIKMPGMDGYETTRQIRQFNHDIRIIAQTAHASPGEREKALLAGCDDFITKPFYLNDLLEVLSRNIK